jgi:hypothetical protein
MILHYISFIVIYIFLAIFVAYLGQNRKWGFWGYLWSSLIFTPLLGLIFILASDPRPSCRDYTE